MQMKPTVTHHGAPAKMATIKSHQEPEHWDVEIVTLPYAAGETTGWHGHSGNHPVRVKK